MRIFRTGLVLALVICICACSSSVRTKVSTFRDAGVPVGSGTIKVEPLDPGLKGSLEFKYYKEGLERKLSQVGYQIANGDTQYIAKLDYSVTRQEAENTKGSKIVVGTGVGFTPRYSRSGLYFSESFEKRFEFERMLVLVITDTEALKAAEQTEAEDKPVNILEVTARSVGNCESLPIVYEEMLSAIFQDLARPNGSMHTVKVKGDSRC